MAANRRCHLHSPFSRFAGDQWRTGGEPAKRLRSVTSRYFMDGGNFMDMIDKLQAAVLAHRWVVRFPDIPPVERKYQWAVSLDLVLADHRAALAAEPVLEEPAS